MESNDIPAPGWDAIDNALKPIYGGQVPKHYGTVISYQLGGPDPLQGISAYKRSDPVPHWHYVSYGFSELYDKKSEDKAVSGWGFELTLRLKGATDSDERQCGLSIFYRILPATYLRAVASSKSAIT